MGTNSLHFNNSSNVSSVAWSFPGGWSYNATSGFDINVYSWSGSNSFSVTVTNSCGSYSTFFYPTGGSYRVANSSSLYPNVAKEYVNIALADGVDWMHVNEIRVVSASTGILFYSSKDVRSNILREINIY